MCASRACHDRPPAAVPPAGATTVGAMVESRSYSARTGAASTARMRSGASVATSATSIPLPSPTTSGRASPIAVRAHGPGCSTTPTGTTPSASAKSASRGARATTRRGVAGTVVLPSA
jgi:hypothetical protein